MAEIDENTPRDAEGRISVLVEMRAAAGLSPSLGLSTAEGLAGGLQLDSEFAPVPMTSQDEGMAGGGTYIVRGTVASEGDLKQLEADPQVLRVWKDTPIAPFARAAKPEKPEKPAKPSKHGTGPQMDSPAMGTCPFGTCDCTPTTPKGTIGNVASYLGADRIWAQGYRGAGIVVGVLDSGITAQGRPVKSGETSRRIPRVIGGWPVADWGTESSRWGDHGNMCATDVLGMAPEAQLYDLRIAAAGGTATTISRALQAFQWAIDRYRIDGTPQILSNSWGIFQESWDASYARNPSHPFTRKVVEAVDLGIVVLFAAGNCGDTCPDGRCGPDNGSGRSIWGANGHEKVMTVGAVNIHEQLAGYSSRGPAALHPNKPDFCSITHFTGYNHSDSGTSAATPILAGICALLKQASPAKSPAQVKAALIETCKDIGPGGFDVHSGHGIVRALAAHERLTRPQIKRAIDDITTPVRDQLVTIRQFDEVRTAVQLDLTTITRDLLRTDPRIDLLRTTVVSDQLRIPEIDPGRPPGIPPRPFTLSTPHHAADWQSFEDEHAAASDAGIAELAARISETAATLSALIAEYQALTGTE